MDKTVAIIVVGFNSSKYLPDLLNSISSSTYKHLKLIYIDNNSSDNSRQLVKQYCPDAIIQFNSKNLGFAQGNNQGINLALSLKSDFIFLLNHDTVLDPDCISALVKDSDQKSILQPLILIHESDNKTNIVNTSGTYLNFLGFSYCDNYRTPYSRHQSFTTDILAASGAAMFIPSQVIKKIGLLDESYFMYYEDLDYCWRARITGYSVRLSKDALVWHKYRFKSTPLKWYYSEFSRLYFFFKNFQTFTIFKVLPLYLINELLSLIYSIYGGFFIQKLRAYIKLVLNIPNVVFQRRQLDKLRKVPDNNLKCYISCRLSFSEVRIPFVNVYNAVIGYYYRFLYLKI